MARRIIEEDVPSTTVVDSDGSWVGRTIVSLVLIAVLVLGAIWLFNNIDGDDVDGGDGDTKKTELDADINVNDGDAPAPEQS